MTQRPIKFRAWHIEKNSMIEGSLLFWFKAIAESGKGESVFHACEWMESTGLHDKNGKEIWEGDILKASQEWFELGSKIGIVGFNKGKFCIHDEEWDNTDYITNREVEVIGNVFENPELLK